MSKDKPGFLNEKDAEKCKVVMDGKPCPLFYEIGSICKVRFDIDGGRNDRYVRAGVIKRYSTQSPDKNCPAKYK